MTSEDKRKRNGWYESYADARAKVKEIDKAKKLIAKLEGKTEKDMKKGAALASRTDLLNSKTAWKGHIKRWENQFLIEHGAKPTQADKSINIASWYKAYAGLGVILVNMEKEILAKSMEEDADEVGDAF